LSRLRATLSPTEADREIQTALDRAGRDIEAALRVASQVRLARHDKRKTMGDLRQALDLVHGVRRLGASVASAPAESYEDWKARRDQRRQERHERQVVGEQADG